MILILLIYLLKVNNLVNNLFLLFNINLSLFSSSAEELVNCTKKWMPFLVTFTFVVTQVVLLMTVVHDI